MTKSSKVEYCKSFMDARLISHPVSWFFFFWIKINCCHKLILVWKNKSTFGGFCPECSHTVPNCPNQEEHTAFPSQDKTEDKPPPERHWQTQYNITSCCDMLYTFYICNLRLLRQQITGVRAHTAWVTGNKFNVFMSHCNTTCFTNTKKNSLLASRRRGYVFFCFFFPQPHFKLF